MCCGCKNQDPITEAYRLLGWAQFNLGKGKTEAAMELIRKAKEALKPGVKL